MLLVGSNRHEEAERAIRGALFLDGSTAICHFTLGMVLRQRQDPTGARKAFSNALELCAHQPADAAVLFADEECYGSLRQAIVGQLELLR